MHTKRNREYFAKENQENPGKKTMRLSKMFEFSTRRFGRDLQNLTGKSQQTRFDMGPLVTK